MNRFKAKIKLYGEIIRLFFRFGAVPDRFRPFAPYFFRIYDQIKIKYIACRVKLICGPAVIPYTEDQAIVLCLVKDGEPWIKDFIEHHFSKGFKHIVLLDNGSADNTIEIARQYSRVSILQTYVPFRRNNILLRRYLLKRFSKGRWSLTVDVDELWDYPFSDKVDLSTLLRYLRQQGANALIAQMLDLFAPSLPSESRPLREYDCYDISSIIKGNLRNWGDLQNTGFFAKKLLNESIYLHRGGIRYQLFGLSGVWLTKMPLIFFDNEIFPLTHQHFSNNATIADISSVLLHYKFTHVFREQVKVALIAKQYSFASGDYRYYSQILNKNPSLTIEGPTVQKFNFIDQLIKDEFLVVSDAYVQMANGGGSELVKTGSPKN